MAGMGRLRDAARNRFLNNPALRRAQLGLSMRATPWCCFLWLPKTAGTSVQSWLEAEIGMRKLRDRRDFLCFPNVGAVTFGHVHYLSLLDAGFVSRHYHDNSVRFAVVRNPYDRIVSLYRYIQEHRACSLDFRTFLNEVEHARPPVGLYNVAGLSQGNRQLDWLMDANGELLTGHVFQQEKLEEMEDVLPGLLGVTFKTRIPRRNVSKARPSVDEMLGGDVVLLEQINRIYASDFQRLGYQMISP